MVEGASGSCPASPWGYHVGRVALAGEHEIAWTGDEDGHRAYSGVFDPPGDGWPLACDFCGFVFTGSYEEYGTKRYTDVSRLYRRADSGALVALRGPHGEGGRGPVGLLTHAEWWQPFQEWTDRYGDGINLLAVCPNGAIWHVDGAAYDGETLTLNAWARTGDPRNPPSLSVTPSIVADDYHGHLTAGNFTAGI